MIDNQLSMMAMMVKVNFDFGHLALESECAESNSICGGTAMQWDSMCEGISNVVGLGTRNIEVAVELKVRFHATCGRMPGNMPTPPS